MALNVWQNELIRCCNTIDRETTQSLNNIQAYFTQSGLSFNHEFKISFLKTVNYRLMETCKRFEMVLSMEKCLTGGKFVSIDKMDDVPMREASSDYLDEHMLPNIIGNTPFLVANTPTNAVDHILNDPLTPSPPPQNQIQPLVVPAAKSKVKREWICFYCKDQNRGAKNFAFSTIHALLDHWQLQHTAIGPFRFYLVDLLTCNIKSCRYFSTFYGLQKHHHKEHGQDNFVVVQNNRCALCLYDGTNLDAHTCKKLEKVQQLKLFNPIVYTEDDVADLQRLNRKFVCKYCESMFTTSQEFMSHHHEQHRLQNIETQEPDVQRIVGFICGCCQISFTPDKLVQHLKSIAQKRWSNTNTWDCWFQQFQNNYLKTKVIFSNGLVVFRQNLIKTDLGGSPAYKNLARDIFKVLKNNSNSFSH